MPESLLQKLLSERWFECIQDKENGFWRPINYCSQLSVLDIGREKKQKMRICGNESVVELWVCPECSLPICQTCASTTIGLVRAVRPFLDNLPCAAWKKLHRLSCQSLEDFDWYLFECLDDVTKAISTGEYHEDPVVDCSIGG